MRLKTFHSRPQRIRALAPLLLLCSQCRKPKKNYGKVIILIARAFYVDGCNTDLDTMKLANARYLVRDSGSREKLSPDSEQITSGACPVSSEQPSCTH